MLDKRFKWNEIDSKTFESALKNNDAEINEISQRIDLV